MRRIWEWLGLNLGRRAGLVGVLGLLVTVALGFGIATLKFTTSNSDYLNKSDPAYVDSVRYESLFGGDPMAVLITMNPGKSINDLFTPANQRLMSSLDTRLSHDRWVYSEISPLDAISLTKSLLSSPDGNPLDSPAATIVGGTLAEDHTTKGISIRATYLGTQFKALTAIPTNEQTFSNPKWVNFLAHETNGKIREALQAVLPNNQHALFAVYLQPNLDIVHESTAAQSVLNILSTAHFQNATTITTGVPAVLKVINSYLRGGILVLGGIAAIVMSIILLLTFSVRWRLLPFFIVAIGLVWAFGLVGYFGIPLTLATIAALPVLLGVGMDYAIQMHSRIEEEVVLDRAPHPVQSAARGLGPALLVVTFDAVFAFAAMWFAKVPDIRKFGSLLVVGIIAVCICSIIATLAILGIREFKSPTRAKDFSKGRMSRIVVRLGSLPARSAIPLAIASLIIFAAGIAVEGKLVLQTNPIDWLNQNSQAIKNVVTLKNASGSNQQIGAVVTTKHPWSDATVGYVARMADSLEKEYPHVLMPATGIVNTLDEVMNMPGTSEVPPTGQQAKSLYVMATPSMKTVMVAKNGSALNIIWEVKSDTLSSLEPVVNTLEHEHPPPGVTVSPGGISIVGVGLLQNLAKARTLLTYLALLFVGIWLALRLRSVIRSLLSLVPVLIAVGGVSLAAVAAGIKLSPLTAVSGPLVVAVCTEFTSLMLLRFVEERNRGYEPREAMQVTASRTGRAFMVSGMTAIAGVAVIATSPMPLLSDFGMIVALNVGTALLCALVVLPPILVWADAPERGWVSRGLLRPVPPPIEFEHPAWRRPEPPPPEREEEPAKREKVVSGAPAAGRKEDEQHPVPTAAAQAVHEPARASVANLQQVPERVEVLPLTEVPEVPRGDEESASEPGKPLEPVASASEPGQPPEPVFVQGETSAIHNRVPVEGPEPAEVERPQPVRLEAAGPVGVPTRETMNVEIPEPASVDSPEPASVEGPEPVHVEAPDLVPEAPEPVRVEAPEPVTVDVAEAPEPVTVDVAEAPEPVPVDISEAPEPVPVDISEPVGVGTPEAVGVEVAELVPEPQAMARPEPVAVEAPVPVQAEVPEPVEVEVPELVGVAGPEAVDMDAPEPVQAEVPEPVGVESPEPVQVDTPEPVVVGTLEHVGVGSPEHVGVGSPEPVGVGSPEPVGVAAPAPPGLWAQEPTAAASSRLTTPRDPRIPEPLTDPNGSDGRAAPAFFPQQSPDASSANEEPTQLLSTARSSQEVTGTTSPWESYDPAQALLTAHAPEEQVATPRRRRWQGRTGSGPQAASSRPSPDALSLLLGDSEESSLNDRNAGNG